MRRQSDSSFNGNLALVWVCVLFLLFLSACRSMPEQALPLAEPLPDPSQVGMKDPGLDVWREGVKFFEAGEYEKALVVFETVHENAHSDELRNQALFDQIAVLLFLAQSPEEYGQALSRWNQWGPPSLPEPVHVDPRTLTPFLRKLNPPKQLESPERRDIHGGGEKGHDNAYTNYLLCRQALRNRDKEVDRLKASLVERAREIRNLRRQINSLEEIHLKFQGLKQESATP